MHETTFKSAFAFQILTLNSELKCTNNCLKIIDHNRNLHIRTSQKQIKNSGNKKPVKTINQTKDAQKKIDSLEQNGGGTLDISKKTKFKLSELRMGDKVNLRYSTTSVLDKDSGHSKNSGEWYHFISGSNKNGAVNEYVVASTFHPGLILDVRKDILGQNHLISLSRFSAH